MISIHRPRRAFIITELAASLGLMGLLAVVIAMMMAAYRRADDYYMTQRRLQLAVEGQMEVYRAGQALPASPSAMVERDTLSLTVRHSPAAGDWAGLRLVEIHGSAPDRQGRTVTVVIRAYLPPEALP